MYRTASFDAIGVTNQVTVTDPKALPTALSIARGEVAALDRACSRFRDDSELSALNHNPGRPVEVSPLLLDALEAGIAAAEATDGLVDPTVGAAMRGLGYDRDFDVLVSIRPRPAFTLMPASGWRSVRIDRSRGSVTLRRGTELDLGATAKAFAADRIARIAQSATGAGVLIALGGDIAVHGGPRDGWPIRVTDNHRAPDGEGQTVAIQGGGLATSSTTVRRWRAGSAEMHHIVDPATGVPAVEYWRTVTVAAATCVDANTAATAAIIKGRSALSWLEDLGLSARLVRVDGSVTVSGAWPAEGSG